MYEVKNVKSFIGRESHGFACSVYKDGKKIGEALEPGDGGPMDYRWTERISEIELEAHVLTLPKFKVFEEEIDQTIDIFITDLVKKYEFYSDFKSMVLGCINDNMEAIYEWVMSQEEGKKTPLL